MDRKEFIDRKVLKPMQPCLHKGSFSHTTHPCELCGRIQGQPAYKVVELFSSIQGEGGQQGRWTLFVRFAGCTLNCSFCDTDMSKFTWFSEPQLLAAITPKLSDYLVFTGGEPTMAPLSPAILRELSTRKAGLTIGLESNGTLPAKVYKEYDYVTISPKNEDVNLKLITEHHDKPIDEIRILVSGKGCTFPVTRALEYAESNVPELVTDEYKAPVVYLSPLFTPEGTIDQSALDHCLRLISQYGSERLRLSVQIHKLLNLK